MRHITFRTTMALAAAVSAVPVFGAIDPLTFPNPTNQGVSTSRTPYVVPVAPGVRTVSIFTVGTLDMDGPDVDALPDVVTLDTVNNKSVANGDPVAFAGNPYILTGLPDGLGALDDGNEETFTLLVNHEMRPDVGVVRAHGSIGSYVSKWTINKNTLEVVNGQDLVRSVNTWDTVTSQYVNGTAIFNRLCSADLPETTAFLNSASGNGTSERIFMNGEETNGGRGFGHIVTGANAGTSYELPRTGKIAWENSIANPHEQDKTIVMSMDDADRGFSSEAALNPSEIYMYTGTKQNSGSEVDRAGLTNGNLYGMKVTGRVNENQIVNGDAFTMHNFGNVENTTGATLQTDAITQQVTQFRRIEDGQWDTGTQSNDFYFVTTDLFNGDSKLWRTRFSDVTNPESGGTIESLLSGSDGVQMMDNMTLVNGLDGQTRVLIQEDTGNQTHNSKIWMYEVETDTLTLVAKHDPARFGDGSPSVAPFDTSGALTGRSDEESSGIIPAWDILGPGWFLLDVQGHYSGPGTGLTAEMVEGGQLAAIFIPQSIPEPASLSLVALIGLIGGRRRK